MESLEKLPCPQSISGVSQQNSTAAFSETTEVAGDFEKSKTTEPPKFQIVLFFSDAAYTLFLSQNLHAIAGKLKRLKQRLSKEQP